MQSYNNFLEGQVQSYEKSEVADRIMDTIRGQSVTFPINVVPPMLRYELARRGVKFGPISGSVAKKDIPMLNDLIERINGGEYDAGLEGVTDYVDAYNSTSEAKERRVGELSQKLGVPVRVISDPSEIASLPWRMRHAKGWWDGKKGEIKMVGQRKNPNFDRPTANESR